MTDVSLDPEELKSWIGRTEIFDDEINLGPAARLHATLEEGGPAPALGDDLPPLWHWIYFINAGPRSELGTDGLPETGDLVPPLPLPRRMFAGGRIEVTKPLVIGEAGRRTSSITDITPKTGRSGELCFVTQRHEFTVGGDVRLIEEHDIVYREEAGPDDVAPLPLAAPSEAQWSETVQADPVLLFAYSALTFNNHRIHYDYPYCTGEEGYDGLVVHGPLTSTLLTGLLRRNLPAAKLKRFSFRAIGPITANAPFRICGNQRGDKVELWATDAAGNLAMKAEAEIV